MSGSSVRCYLVCRQIGRRSGGEYCIFDALSLFEVSIVISMGRGHTVLSAI